MERRKKGPILAIFLLFFGPILAMEEMREQPPQLENLSLDEKIGQLLMVAIVSTPVGNETFMDASPYALDPETVAQSIKKHHIGGVIFLGTSYPETQTQLTADLQKKSRYPLLVAQDLEWGLAMRHNVNVITFPKALTLGALCAEDEHLIYDLGREIGHECEIIGVHMNMAPVVDISSNPNNPIINARSFGDDPKKVAHKAALFMRGMKAEGLISCAKHFPGHGDTDTDSHVQLPVVRHSREHLNQVELAPFRYLIEQEVPAIMTAHLAVPAISGSEALPATLSEETVALLRNELGFEGVILTDGLGMKGVTKNKTAGEAEFEALKAGHDLLLCPVNIESTIERIKKGLKEGEISEETIDEHVLRILQLKKNIKKFTPMLNNDALTSQYVKHLSKRLYESAVTLVHDQANHLPLQSDTPTPVLSTNYYERDSCFMKKLTSFIQAESSGYLADSMDIDELAQRLENHKQIIVKLSFPARSGMIELEHQQDRPDTLPDYISLINKLGKKVILVLFGSHYNVKHFDHAGTVIVGYENQPAAHEAVAKILAGKQSARGILPTKIK